VKHIVILLGLVLVSINPEPLKAQPYLFGVDTGSDLAIADIGAGIVDSRVSVGFPLSIGLSIDHTRAFISDFNGQVIVLDTTTAAILASIPVSNAGGIAVHPNGSAVYVASRNSASIKVIDPASLAIVSSIALPSDLPRGLAISPGGDRLYVAHQDGAGTLTVIDTVSNAILASTPTAANALRVSLGRGGLKAYVSSRVPTIGYEMVTVVDTSTLTIDASLRLNPLLANACPCAGEVAALPDGTRFFVAAQNAILEYNASTNGLISSTPLADGTTSMVIGPDGFTAYLGGESSYQVFDTSSHAVSPLIACSFCGREDIVLSSLGPPPSAIQLAAAQDTFLRSGQANTNEGANLNMHVDSNSRALVGFNLGNLHSPVAQAHLRLYIVDNGGNWGNTGRSIDAHRTTTAWSEGNGANLRPSNLTNAQFRPFENRGDGAGATWDCAVDTEIHNQSTDCSSPWNGGAYVAGPTASVTIFKYFAGNNNLPSTTATLGWVDFDVTTDVSQCLSNGESFCGWLIRKTLENQPGHLEFATKEGAAALYNGQVGESVAPQLIVQP
jgi:DNA-binding beta-propeller fold protein YncE